MWHHIYEIQWENAPKSWHLNKFIISLRQCYKLTCITFWKKIRMVFVLKEYTGESKIFKKEI